MRARLAVLPTWLLAAAQSLVFAATIFAFLIDIGGPNWPPRVITGAVAAGVFGLMSWIAIRHGRRGERAIVAGLNREQERAVVPRRHGRAGVRPRRGLAGARPVAGDPRRP